VPQELLLGSYPHVSCSQPSDQAHRCFSSGPPLDFIVSVPLLGALDQQMGQAILDRFLLEALGTFGEEQYERQLRGLCSDVDVSKCFSGASPR